MIALFIPAADFGAHTLTFVSENSTSSALFALRALAAMRADAPPSALWQSQEGDQGGHKGVTRGSQGSHKGNTMGVTRRSQEDHTGGHKRITMWITRGSQWEPQGGHKGSQTCFCMDKTLITHMCLHVFQSSSNIPHRKCPSSTRTHEATLSG